MCVKGVDKGMVWRRVLRPVLVLLHVYCSTHGRIGTQPGYIGTRWTILLNPSLGMSLQLGWQSIFVYTAVNVNRQFKLTRDPANQGSRRLHYEAGPTPK